MINPVKEIYEMEFRQQELARELENIRRVNLVKGVRKGPAHLLARIGQLLRWRRRAHDPMPVGLKRPSPEGGLR